MDNFSFNRKSLKSNSNSIKPFSKNGFASKNHFGQSNNKFSFSKPHSGTTTSLLKSKNQFGSLQKENPFSKPAFNRFSSNLGKGSNLSYAKNTLGNTHTAKLPTRLGNANLSGNTSFARLGQGMGNSHRPSFSESQGFSSRFTQHNDDLQAPTAWQHKPVTYSMPRQHEHLNMNKPLNNRPIFNRDSIEAVDYEEDMYDDNEYHESATERTPFASHNIRRPINIEKRSYEPHSFQNIRDMQRGNTLGNQQPQHPFVRDTSKEEAPLREDTSLGKKKPIDLTNLHALALESVYEDMQDANEDLHNSKFYNIFGDCNVKILSDHTYKISLEAAGYTKADMKIILNPDDTLVVFGDLKYPDKDKYIHIGLLPKFYKSFILGKNSAVLGASLENGILSIDIKEQDDDKRNTATIPIT